MQGVTPPGDQPTIYGKLSGDQYGPRHFQISARLTLDQHTNRPSPITGEEEISFHWVLDCVLAPMPDTAFDDIALTRSMFNEYEKVAHRLREACESVTAAGQKCDWNIISDVWCEANLTIASLFQPVLNRQGYTIRAVDQRNTEAQATEILKLWNHYCEPSTPTTPTMLEEATRSTQTETASIVSSIYPSFSHISCFGSRKIAPTYHLKEFVTTAELVFNPTYTYNWVVNTTWPPVPEDLTSLVEDMEADYVKLSERFHDALRQIVYKGHKPDWNVISTNWEENNRRIGQLYRSRFRDRGFKVRNLKHKNNPKTVRKLTSEGWEVGYGRLLPQSVYSGLPATEISRQVMTAIPPLM